MSLEPGSRITVEVINHTNADPRLFKNSKTKTYSGKLLPNEPWQEAGTFRMTSDNNIVPTRVIPWAWVVKMNGVKSKDFSDLTFLQPMRERPKKEEKPDIKEFQIESSKGDTNYTVRVYPDGKVTCTCPAFTIRHMECKHIKKVLSELFEKE